MQSSQERIPELYADTHEVFLKDLILRAEELKKKDIKNIILLQSIIFISQIFGDHSTF